MSNPVTRHGWWVITLSIASVVAGLVLGYRELFALGVGGGIASVAALAWVLVPTDLSIVRDVTPQRVTRSTDPDDRRSVSHLIIENRRQRLSLPVVARDRVAGEVIDIVVPRLRGGASWERTEPLATNRRGVYEIGPILVRRSDPFGIAEVERAQGVVTHLFVRPIRHELRVLPSAFLQSVDGPVSDNSLRGSQIFQTVREYELGDDRRFIHWPSTARSVTGKFFVRQFVDTTEPELTVLLDASEIRQTEQSFEESVEVAASIVEHCLGLRFPITLDGLTVDPIVGRDEVTLGVALDALTAVQLTSGDEFMARVGRLAKVGRGSAAVVVTAAIDPNLSQALSHLRSAYRSLIVIDLRPDRSTIAVVPRATYMPLLRAADLDSQWRAVMEMA